ncbi:hypothetical protein VaNZ11_009489, partial [Volvox africanus]
KPLTVYESQCRRCDAETSSSPAQSTSVTPCRSLNRNQGFVNSSPTEAPIDMQSSQSNTTTVDKHDISSTSSARGANAPTRTRSAAKKPTGHYSKQPTLKQVFNRAAAAKPATATSTLALRPGPGPADADDRPSCTTQPATLTQTVEPAVQSVHPLRPAARRLSTAHDCSGDNSTASAASTLTDGSWAIERVVVPFTASSAAAASTALAFTSHASSPSAAPLLPPQPLSHRPPSPIAVASGAAVGRRSLQQQAPGLSSMPYSTQAITTTPTVVAAVDGSDVSYAESHRDREDGHFEGPSMGRSVPTRNGEASQKTTAAEVEEAGEVGKEESNPEMEVLSVRLARMRVRSAAAVPLPPADTIHDGGNTTPNKAEPYLKPLQHHHQQQENRQCLASSSEAGTEERPPVTRGSIKASLVPSIARPAASSSSFWRGAVHEGLSSSVRESGGGRKGWPVIDLVSEESALEIPSVDGGRQVAANSVDNQIAVAPPPPPPPPPSTSTSAAGGASSGIRAAAGPKGGDSGGGAAAATKPSSRSKSGAKVAVKAARSGKAPGGALLWTEMSVEERAATGGASWIRWEPLSPSAVAGEADGAGSGAASAAPLFHLFSVDIETVDFMRGRQAFPRPDQVRLIEVAAVDLGPYDGGVGAVPGGAGFGSLGVRPVCNGGGHIFSTLVNCGRSFKAHKTIMHNGITWEESSAPGVPNTAEALQRLFNFINQCCDATAEAAAASLSATAATVIPRVIPVLMAHNGTIFDFPVLRSECGRVGVEWPQEWWYFDTLLAAKVLWSKADWPLKPQEGLTGDGDDVAGEEGEGEEEADEPGNSAIRNNGGGGAAKRSLSMDALKVWAGVTSKGQAHRAEVDAVDLAAVWRRLFEQWGRPSMGHLERLGSARGASKTAAGPMHRIGLHSLAAKADSLVRHMEAAVATKLSAPPSAAGAATAAAVPPIVVGPAQLRKLAEASRLHLRKPRGGGGGGGSFWLFEVLGEPLLSAVNAGGGRNMDEEKAAMTESDYQDNTDIQKCEDSDDDGEAHSQQKCIPPPPPPPQQQQQQWQPSLAPFVVLLRGVKLRYMARASYAYKPDHAPKWELVLAAAGSGTPGSGGEGASSPEEVSELVRLMDGLARHASVQARGDAGRSAKLYSCGKEDGKGKAGKMSIAVQLHSQLSRGPAPGQLRWEPLATLATYDKKTSSYRALPWPVLESYLPAPSSSAGLTGQSQQGLSGGPSELERIKEDNLARIAALLPDVASNEVLDVAVWPEFCWVNNSGFGIRLKAVHLVRRTGR